MKESTIIAMLFLYYHKHYFSWYSIKSYLLHIPYVRDKLLNVTTALKNSLSYNNTSNSVIKRIPHNSFTEQELDNHIKALVKENEKTNISGVIYNNDNYHKNKLLDVFGKYSSSNPLHPDIFPQIRLMETEIVCMVTNLFKGDDQVCGNVTSGGTESILLACYAYREFARNEKGITNPNIVAFTSVHPAFDKACHYFGIKLKKYKSWERMKWGINRNTICVIGSAPTYAYGLLDPIEEMSNYCLYYEKPFHVDCCMGGFLMPFLDGNPVHFLNIGITSISADTHKYGNCFKGSSVLLFRSNYYKKHQHFVKTDWEGGIYATPTLLGSKSGGLIATTWASLMYTGSIKYARFAKNIQNHIRNIVNEFYDCKDILLIGKPDVNIVAFKSGTLNIYNVVSKMTDWDLSILANPAAFHFCITSAHTDEQINKFILDLKNAIDSVRSNPEETLEGTLAIYGSTEKIENSIFTEDVVNSYLEFLS